ncbi:FadR/GntR family transcriptional regulator [Lichenihabitans sp. Uapishka_5]|uniref:FadR/GntR family transcriptional regulator n=1 Tax=Lichenihabitans sp. Uapishka_5 TaxID=3037302 RepID=UPI0029E818AA|nr:FadR/GntR family transcriptional regulator [Lichenihabitans sp. Uapishka_5]MDX7951175.1 FadR/GntR family transcriptional regulator [Lichenihabitans sp. Uapishka_5]
MLERELVPIGTMSTQIAALLGSRIVGGEFRPGATLPVEAELCGIYGVSRTVIREAVKNLSAKRLIEVSPKVGTRVLPFADWNLLDRDVLTWRLSAQFDAKIVADIFEMRLCFEPRASFLAARDGTVEDFGAIEHHFHELARAFETDLTIEATAQAELAFHLAVIQASHNGLFVTVGSTFKSALRVSSQMLQRHAIQPAETLATHDAVRAAILARDPTGAADAMERLLHAARDRLLPLAVPIP